MSIGEEDFYVVGIGASAGGVQALQQLISSIEGNPNVAFVIIQHFKRDYETKLDLVLSNWTHLPIEKVEAGAFLEKNKIFIAPQNMNVSIVENKFYLEERSETEIINHTINHFFISLAEAKKEKAIGVILSGTGSDGTKGFHAIEKNYGHTIVQNPQTAQFDGMPNHSIQFDHPDYILAPEEMPKIIVSITEGKDKIEDRGKLRLSDF